MSLDCPNCKADISKLIAEATAQEAQKCIEHASKWIQKMVEEGVDYKLIQRAATLTIFENQIRLPH